MKNFALFSALLMFLTSCGPSFDGHLSVMDTLTFAGKTKTVIVGPGVYEVDLDIISKKEFVLRLPEDDVSFKLDPDADIEVVETGTYTVMAEHTNQHYDLLVSVDKGVSKTPTASTYEDCMVFKPGNPAAGIPPTTVHGRKIVYYHNVTTTTDLILDLMFKETGRSHGTYDGRSTQVRKIVEHEGRCM